MATVNPVQKLYGTAAQNAAVTLPSGIIVYLTDTKEIAVHDGSTAGGTIFKATPDASQTEKGIVELATSAETVTGESEVLAVHPAGVAAAIAAASIPTILQGSKTYDPAADLDETETITTTVTVTGAETGDACFANHSELSGGIGVIHAEITSANTATVKFNSTANDLNIGSGTLTVTVIQS